MKRHEGNPQRSPLGEFELIERFFARGTPGAHKLAVGIGDDCALLDAGALQWAVTTDMLVEGVHFLPDVDPAALGHKALAVNLSDLAACGAEPHSFFLALALPAADERWLAGFAAGLFALADLHRCALAGGDTTQARSGVVISITAIGTVEPGRALLRSGAAPGDDLWVSGELGDAAMGLAIQRGEIASVDAEHAIARLERPTPRVALGRALAGVAASAIDVSDGLLADLRHLAQRSGVGARIDWANVPRSPWLRRLAANDQQRLALAGGDDYELLFTAPAAQRSRVEAAAADVGVAVSRIGAIDSTGELVVADGDGRALHIAEFGYQHFGGR